MKWRPIGSTILAVSVLCTPVLGDEGAFIGAELGVSEPTNDNYRSHVEMGATAAPFVGYMFSDYLGLQGQLHFNAQPPDDNDNRPQPDLDNRNQWTTMLGLTVGPRLSIPLGEVADLYFTGQGGGFKGLGGRLNQWAPGFTVGGGIDFNLTERFAVGLFGRWNRAYMAPHPTFLVGHVPNDDGPEDAQWVSTGVAMKYSFAAEPPPPPQAPPPPPPKVAQAPPPPPTKRTFVLRAVNFDFDKATLKPEAKPILQEIVDHLKNNPDWNIVLVEGHTDSVGSDAYNLKLSRRRAESVREYLVSQGIAASRIRAEGFGETKPVASNDSAAGRAENRRVEVNIE